MRHFLTTITPILTLALSLTTLGCSTASEHRAEVDAATTSALTAGVVQKEVRICMSGSEVASTLGSPNIVTTD